MAQGGCGPNLTAGPAGSEGRFSSQQVQAIYRLDPGCPWDGSKGEKRNGWSRRRRRVGVEDSPQHKANQTAQPCASGRLSNGQVAATATSRVEQPAGASSEAEGTLRDGRESFRPTESAGDKVVEFLACFWPHLFNSPESNPGQSLTPRNSWTQLLLEEKTLEGKRTPWEAAAPSSHFPVFLPLCSLSGEETVGREKLSSRRMTREVRGPCLFEIWSVGAIPEVFLFSSFSSSRRGIGGYVSIGAPAAFLETGLFSSQVEKRELQSELEASLNREPHSETLSQKEKRKKRKKEKDRRGQYCTWQGPQRPVVLREGCPLLVLCLGQLTAGEFGCIHRQQHVMPTPTTRGAFSGAAPWLEETLAR
ncbi:PREDICTED: uncharacterized protein LOC102012708 [Chinchilla lanigera]|uniref:uncharacterized protein LOC102012708 n=1 Tax=Chinchilla lanigera TaxID=34839 RepID=UPI00038F0D4A|nr:PREDICTED: uncharacterized protein LOC102012708 [Chinchilla lanigera]XP_005393454.1 PREDICTED: uncharacterized protein LOC102012708 [Chinchilla lanigera]